MKKSDLKACGYSIKSSDLNRRAALNNCISYYGVENVLVLLYMLVINSRVFNTVKKLSKDIEFIHRVYMIPKPQQFQQSDALLKIINISGGDVNTDISNLSSSGIQLLQKQLYKIPGVGKVLQVVGDNAESGIMKALSLFGYKPKTSYSILAKEQGIDVFEWNRDFTPDELHIFGYDWITPQDQALFRAYSSEFPQTGGYISNYQAKLTSWLQKYNILAKNQTIDQALSSQYPPYIRFNSVLNALTNAHGELANVNSILYQKGLLKKGAQLNILAMPTQFQNAQ